MAGKKTSVIQVMIAGDSSDLQKATRGGVSGFNLLAGAAIAATKIMVSAASAIAGFSIREFAKFDDAMTKSTAIMGDLSDTMRKDMSDAARQVALETTFAADEAAEAFFFLASAGLTAEQSIAALPQVARFAQAGAFDLALATDLLTDAQSALGLTSDDTAENMLNMARVSDVLAKANNISNATIQEFSEALTEKAGVAMRQLGIDIEEGTAALAIFARQGVKGTKAGTLLNTTLEGLARTADMNKEAYDALGVSVFDNKGEMRNLADIVGDLEGALGGMSVQARNAELRNLGFTRQARDGVLQLLGNADALRKYESELRNAAGTTDEIAEKQLQSFNAQLSLLRSGLSDVALSIGEALAGPLGRLVTWFQDQIPAIKAFVEESIPQVEAFVNRSIVKFQEFKTFFNENLRDPLNEFKETIKGFGTIGLGEFEALVERFKTFAPDFRAAIEEADAEEAGRLLGEFIANTFRSAFDTAGDITQPLTDWAKSQDWGAIGMTVGSFAVEFLVGFFKGLFSDPAAAQNEADRGSQTITQTFSDSLLNGIFAALLVSRLPIIGAPVRLLLRPLFAGFKMLGGAIFTRLVPFLGGLLWRAISGAFSLVGRGIVSLGGMILSGIAGAFRAAFAAAASALAPLFQVLLITVRGAFRRWAFQFAGVAGATIRTAIMALLRVGVRALLKVVAGLAAAIFGWPAVLVAAVLTVLGIFFLRFRQWFEGKEDEFSSIGAAVIEFFVQGLRNIWDTILESRAVALLVEVVDTIKAFFSDKYQEFLDVGGNIIVGLVDGVKKKAGKLKDALVNAARDAWNATKNFLGISSPSKLFEGVGEEMMNGMSRGISASAGIIQASVGVNSSMAANEARRFADMAAARRAERQPSSRPAAPINITVTSADPQAVVEALRRYTRGNGPLGQVVTL